MDFDDLIMVTVNLFQAFPDLAAYYRRKFRHVLVDEYQDTNHAQYALVRELVGTQPTRWATMSSCRQASSASSATPTSRSMPSAARRSAISPSSSATFPAPASSCLSRNRSTQNILAAANAVVSLNTGRLPKNLWSDAGDGPPLVGYVAERARRGRFRHRRGRQAGDAGDETPGEVAVFYRTNAQSRVFEEVFIRAGLP